MLRDRVLQVLEDDGGSERMTVGGVADQLGMRPDYLSAKFRKVCGMSVKAFIDQYRFEKALRLLQYSLMSISEIAEELGFTDVYTFSRQCKCLSGISPSAFRKSATGKGGIIRQ